MQNLLSMPNQEAQQINLYLCGGYNVPIDPIDLVVNVSNMQKMYWVSNKFVHVEGHEELHPSMTEPRELDLVVRANVDTYYASDIMAMMEMTRFSFYLNSVLIF